MLFADKWSIYEYKLHESTCVYIHVYCGFPWGLQEHNVDKADVFAQPPYYSHFEWLANYSLQTARWNPYADPKAPTTIEIVT